MSLETLKLTSTKGDDVIVNWRNVTHALKTENALPDTKGTEIFFVNKRSMVVKESISEIKQWWYTGE